MKLPKIEVNLLESAGAAALGVLLSQTTQGDNASPSESTIYAATTLGVYVLAKTALQLARSLKESCQRSSIGTRPRPL